MDVMDSMDSLMGEGLMEDIGDLKFDCIDSMLTDEDNGNDHPIFNMNLLGNEDEGQFIKMEAISPKSAASSSKYVSVEHLELHDPAFTLDDETAAEAHKLLMDPLFTDVAPRVEGESFNQFAADFSNNNTNNYIHGDDNMMTLTGSDDFMNMHQFVPESATFQEASGPVTPESEFSLSSGNSAKLAKVQVLNFPTPQVNPINAINNGSDTITITQHNESLAQKVASPKKPSQRRQRKRKEIDVAKLSPTQRDEFLHKKAIRMQKNRESASASRKRKKEHISILETTVEQQKLEISNLHEKVKQLVNENNMLKNQLQRVQTTITQVPSIAHHFSHIFGSMGKKTTGTLLLAALCLFAFVSTTTSPTTTTVPMENSVFQGHEQHLSPNAVVPSSPIRYVSRTLQQVKPEEKAVKRISSRDYVLVNDNGNNGKRTLDDGSVVYSLGVPESVSKSKHPFLDVVQFQEKIVHSMMESNAAASTTAATQSTRKNLRPVEMDDEVRVEVDDDYYSSHSYRGHGGANSNNQRIVINNSNDSSIALVSNSYPSVRLPANIREHMMDYGVGRKDETSFMWCPEVMLASPRLVTTNSDTNKLSVVLPAVSVNGTVTHMIQADCIVTNYHYIPIEKHPSV
eukprot:m.7620 g.7620  ORF g.7620 m.7620 type:complete len:628 (-) comp2873_c0_seq1:263-2146(-)